MRRRSSVGTNLLTLTEANNRSNGVHTSQQQHRNLDAATVSASNATNGNGGLNKINENGGSADEINDEISLVDEVDAVLRDRCASATDVSDAVAQRSNFGGYLIAVHRKLSRQETYFLSYHKTRPSLFGVPLLIPCYEGGSNKDLYCAVWMQVARLLSPLPSTPPDQSNHATDW